jgi:IPT/TIG domain/Family of unknown function (DUF6519)
MGIISDSTFDPSHGYVNVRLRQGVPIVDADWNELDDIRKFELRAFLKWFVGEGVPDGCDSFSIVGTGEANDFLIKSGCPTAPANTTSLDKGLRYSGNCLVDGMSVLIGGDIEFSKQALHASRNPSPQTLAASGGGGIITALTAPTVNTTLIVYLDVWETLVTADDDHTLLLPGLGIESSSRVRRSWAVRVATKLPEPSDLAPLYVAGHSYYKLASIKRRATDQLVNPDDVTDLRRTRLSLASLMERLAMVEKYRLLPRFNPPGKQFTPRVAVTGQNVILQGSNFTVGTASVIFDGVPASLVGQPTDSQIVVQVPVNLKGEVFITIKTEAGSVTSDDNFLALAKPLFNPSPNQFNPSSGQVGTPVELFGQNFNIGDIQVFFGDTLATLDSPPPTATKIVAKVPEGPVGPVKIKVSNGQESDISVDSFTVLDPPQFDPLTPFNPPIGSVGQTVKLQGQNFNIGTPTVLFGTVTANVTATTATTISVTIPTGVTGDVHITVITSGGSVTSQATFTVA